MTKLPLDLNSRDIDLLIPEFREKVMKVISACAKRKVKLVPFSTLRGPLTQAQFWCEGRSKAQILDMIEHFRQLSCPNIQHVLSLAGAQVKKKPTNTAIKTKSLPGETWHHFGEAVDMYVENKGKPDWHDLPAYAIYTEEAERIGLTSGARFKGFIEPVHIQLSRLGKPAKSFYELDRLLGEKFAYSLNPSVSI